MSLINISHNHSHDKSTACHMSEQMLDDLASKYGLSIDSDGEGYILFTGSGIKGNVTIDHGNITINATLGFFMAAMKPVISSEISRKLEETFS